MNLQTQGLLPVLVILLVLLLPMPAMAYVGPGSGLSAIGAFLAVIAGILVAIFGFIWYPVKRLLRKIKSRRDSKGDGEE